jgi:hypothetical protein
MVGPRIVQKLWGRAARAGWLRLFAILSLLFATAATQEIALIAVGAECCEDDASSGTGDCAPVTCQVCPCCHFSAVLTAPLPAASWPADAGEQPTPPPSATWASSDHREPPFRPPAA